MPPAQYDWPCEWLAHVFPDVHRFGPDTIATPRLGTLSWTYPLYFPMSHLWIDAIHSSSILCYSNICPLWISKLYLGTGVFAVKCISRSRSESLTQLDPVSELLGSLSLLFQCITPSVSYVKQRSYTWRTVSRCHPSLLWSSACYNPLHSCYDPFAKPIPVSTDKDFNVNF